MANVTKWGMGILLALSSVACAEQQAPRVAQAPAYAVVGAFGDDSHDAVEVILECERVECERVAASLNQAMGSEAYWVEVAP
jgi:hypothetical protein